MSEVFLKINGDVFKGVLNANNKSLLESSIIVAAQAKALAPVALKNGGQLRNSIMWKTHKKDGGLNDSGGVKASAKLNEKPKTNEALIGSNLLYSIYQEFGTRRMAPQPFLRPAAETLGIGQIVTSYDKEVTKALKTGKKVIIFK